MGGIFIKENGKIAILIFILLNSCITVSLGITITCSNDGGSTTASYNLDDQTALNDNTAMGDGFNFRAIHISGVGNNEYNLQSNANGAAVQSGIASIGQISASTSSVASGGSAALSQDVIGGGCTSAYTQGNSGQAATEQSSTGINGYLNSAMTTYSGNGFSQSDQNSHISADMDAIVSNSQSHENCMSVLGSLAGGSDIDADLAATAGDTAQVNGVAFASGNLCIDNNALQHIANNDGLGLNVYGTIMGSNSGLGEYSLQAANFKSQTKSSSQPAGGNDYGIIGCLPKSTVIQMQLLGTTIPKISDQNTGSLASTSDVMQAISNGATTWDSATSRQLFATNPVVTYAGTKSIKFSPRPISDGLWTEGWTTGLSSSTIAETFIWTDGTKTLASNGKRYPTISESDCWYNANLAWTIAQGESTSKSKTFDVQTIATHELGHTIGLNDLYSSSDSSEIMYGYNNGQVKWKLTSGDLAGLQALYGK